MNIAYRFRIYPTEEQKILLGKTFGCCRFLYNQMLNDKIQEYKKTKKMLKNTPAMYKKEYPFLKEVDSLALANVQLHLEKAYKNFFRDPEGWISTFQVKTSLQKQLHNKCGQRKYSGRRQPDPASKIKMDLHEKTQGACRKLPSEISDSQYGAVRKVFCKSAV